MISMGQRKAKIKEFVGFQDEREVSQFQ